MNDRFKIRLPFYNNNGEFSHFQYIDVVDGLKPYNAGVMFHRGEYEQCTGLKDKNGKLIYEGDIVKITLYTGNYDCVNEEIYKGTVIWERDCFLVKTDNLDMIIFPHSEDNVEIIGNIHEQAEQKDK